MASTEEPPSENGFQCQDARCATPHKTVWFCGDCDSCLCDTCWEFQVAHQHGKKARDGLAHEKAVYAKVQLYNKILSPPTTAEDLKNLHMQDERTLWFGVSKEKNTLFLNDRGQYSSLMSAANDAREKTIRFPQLVSFIGDTNAGKSTIIQILIRRQQSHSQESLSSDSEFPAPVAGSSSHEKNPTTGDVHLYADPSTFRANLPILYADCEGLEGGTIEPSAIAYRNNAKAASNESKNPLKNLIPMWTKKPRQITWANTEKKKTRDYVVKELYPRLLYTFSDTLVFVLQNPKTFQSVLRMLIRWGSQSLEKALNLPRLPHAIVVLNMTKAEIDEWDPVESTRSCLGSIDAYNSLGGVPEFEELANTWRKETGANITSAHALLMKYYSSFTVVRVPEGQGRFNLLDKQADVLHREIADKCAKSFKSKQEAHMPVTTDGLNKYLQAGFDHFCSTLQEPFNFVKTELESNPPAEDFADHMWALTLLLMQVNADPTPQDILRCLGRIVAPCIVLDAEERGGAVLDHFHAYRPFLLAVLKEYCNKYWPCAFRDKAGRPCVNFSATHVKGHQNSRGTLIGDGPHEPGTDMAKFKREWLQDIQTRIWSLYDTIKDRKTTENRLEILRLDMSEAFYQLRPKVPRDEPAKSYISHTTCLSCLMAVPIHGLPCGHVICTGCVAMHGKYVSETLITMKSCPLHCWKPLSNEPWRIYFKPRHAGSRILSLDGGGVRGIVELEVLRKIESALGGKLPIRAFFDLVIGTSAGGIIALALAVKQWSLSHCTETFLSVSESAFVRRDPTFVPEWMTITAQQSIYKTRGLYQALESQLGTDPLFAGPRATQPEFDIQTAVTATSDIGKGPAIITNYNRVHDKNQEYDMIRSPNSDLEFKIWKAAAATSAAPKYFKAYIHERTDRSFVDGGLYWNNPSVVANQERKLLWPDESDLEPDILLSIGSGFYQADIDRKTANISTELFGVTSDQKVTSRFRRRGGRFRKTVKVLTKRFDNVLDTEMSWNAFKNQVSKSPQSWPDRSPLPYVRINIDLEQKPPKLDDLEALKQWMRGKTVDVLKSTVLNKQIEQIANQLIASTFYFSKESVSDPNNESRYQICTGSIKCRFEKGSMHVKNLGSFLLEQREPRFLIKEKGLDHIERKIDLKEATMKEMISSGVFYLPAVEFPILNSVNETNITLRLHGKHLAKFDYPLSGFPRQLYMEDSRKRAARAASLSGKPKILARWSKTDILGTLSPTSAGTESPSMLSLLQTQNDQEENMSGAASAPASAEADNTVFAHLSTTIDKIERINLVEDTSEYESADEAKI